MAVIGYQRVPWHPSPSVGSSAQGVGAMLNDLGKAEIRQLHIAVRVDQNVLLSDATTCTKGGWDLDQISVEKKGNWLSTETLHCKKGIDRNG